MRALSEGLQSHLQSGCTTLCRAWQIIRSDGVRYGFTDHDTPLAFGGQVFTPDSGLSAMALQQTTGLSVDNTEAIGAISDASISDADVEAGRFDGAEVLAFLVNWAQPAQRLLQFRGTIGDIRRAGGAFQAELRGLTDMLNRPVGRVFQKPCGAVLGDARCKVDIEAEGYRIEAPLREEDNGRLLRFVGLFEPASNWFERGHLVGLSGAAKGLRGRIKSDRHLGGLREFGLWEPMRATLKPGDRFAIYAGCDKRYETCRGKFSNGVNFRGFPDIPEEEWLLAHPAKAAAKDGGSRR